MSYKNLKIKIVIQKRYLLIFVGTVRVRNFYYTIEAKAKVLNEIFVLKYKLKLRLLQRILFPVSVCRSPVALSISFLKVLSNYVFIQNFAKVVLFGPNV